jgi:hypothetical protein
LRGDWQDWRDWSRIDVGDGAVLAVDADEVAGSDPGRRVATSDDGGDAELAGDDRGVGQGRADVGDDDGNVEQDGGSADVDDGRDEDLVGFEGLGVVEVRQDAGSSFDHAGGASGDGAVAVS